jgi:hypothetical protein
VYISFELFGLFQKSPNDFIEMYTFSATRYGGVRPRRLFCCIGAISGPSADDGAEAYFHDQIVYCDDTPDSKVQMNMWRRELGIRVHAVRYALMDDVLRG